MEIREVTYLVRVEAEKAKQQMDLMDKSFDSMINKTDKLDSGLAKFSNSAVANLTKTRLSMEAFKKSFASLQNRQNSTQFKSTGVESTNSNNLNASLDTTTSKTHQTDTALKSMTYNAIRGFDRARMASEAFKASLNSIKTVTGENNKNVNVGRKVSFKSNEPNVSLPNSTRLEQSFTGLNARIKDSGARIDNFSTNSIKSINRIKISVDALKTSLGAIKTQKSVMETPSASKVSNMKKGADNSKVMATNIMGATKSASRLNKQLIETDKLTSAIRKNTGAIKKDLGSTRQIRLGNGSGGSRMPMREGSPTGVGGGLAYSAQAHPLMSAMYRGLGMSTLLHFGGVGAGFLQMGVQQLVKVAQQGIRMAFQTAQEGSEVRKGVIEARSISNTFLTNKAEQEGLDPVEVNKIALQNAKSFAKSTVFTQRQALIAQGALVEGGMGTKDSSQMKTLKTILDRTVARYNKIDVTEQNIQTFINQLATTSVSGKVGKLAFFKQEGEAWMSSFESAKPAERWNMMLQAMEKSSDGLTDSIAQADNSYTASIIQRNRAETLLSGRIGRLGMDFDTLKTSMKSSLIEPMEAFMIAVNKVVRQVNSTITSDLENVKQAGIKGKIGSKEMEEILQAPTNFEMKNLMGKKLGEKYLNFGKDDPTKGQHINQQRAEQMLKSYFATGKTIEQKKDDATVVSNLKTQVNESISLLSQFQGTEEARQALVLAREQEKIINSLQVQMERGDKVLEELAKQQGSSVKTQENIETVVTEGFKNLIAVLSGSNRRLGYEDVSSRSSDSDNNIGYGATRKIQGSGR